MESRCIMRLRGSHEMFQSLPSLDLTQCELLSLSLSPGGVGGQDFKTKDPEPGTRNNDNDFPSHFHREPLPIYLVSVSWGNWNARTI